MKRQTITNLAFLAVLTVTITGCHTAIWQPVKQQLIGRWELTPVAVDSTEVSEIWDFNDNNTLVITHEINGTVIDTQMFFYPEPTDTLTEIEWSVENKLTKHYLYTDAYFNKTLVERNTRWLVVKLKKDKELYLSSEIDKTGKGGKQRGFVRAE